MMKSLIYSLILSLVLFASCSKAQPGKVNKRPNILFIAVDDLRPELHCYGKTQIISPTLDQLAEESLVFNRSYCNVPVCGASRASLLTGTRPTRHRFINAFTYKDKDYPDAISLPKLFKENGYTTISNGKVYHHADDDRAAWDEIWRPKGKISNYNLEENIELASRPDGRGKPYESADVNDTAYWDGKIALKGIDDLIKLKKAGKPFFLAMGFMKPHLPFNAPKKYWDLYRQYNINLPEDYLQPETTPRLAFNNFGELRKYETVPKKGPVSEEMAKELIRGYYACVSYVDAQIGKVLEELKTLGLADNTIIVLWGDHGWNLGNHMLWCKHCTFETAMRTPLFLKVPGKTHGKITNAITEYIDIYPTLCDLAGLQKPTQLEGESLVGLLDGGKRSKDYAVSKFKDEITLVDGNLFYTEWTDDSGKAYGRMLFDHTTDPLELNNLAEKDEYQQKVQQLASELHKRWGKDFLK